MSKLPTDYAARKALPLFDFLTGYFPLAIAEVVKVAVVGNAQHDNPKDKIRWVRSKSTDQLNTAMRHQFDHGMGSVYDETDDGRVPGMRTMHLAKAVWRLMAEIQLICEANPNLGALLEASLVAAKRHENEGDRIVERSGPRPSADPVGGVTHQHEYYATNASGTWVAVCRGCDRTTCGFNDRDDVLTWIGER